MHFTHIFTNHVFGRVPSMQGTYVEAPAHLIGQEIMVRITAAGPDHLAGVVDF